MNVGVQLGKQYKNEKESHRFHSMKQLNMAGILAIRGHESTQSNLIKCSRKERKIPELNQWVENRRYVSLTIINELIEMMGNAAFRSILQDIKGNSGFSD